MLSNGTTIAAAGTDLESGRLSPGGREDGEDHHLLPRSPSDPSTMRGKGSLSNLSMLLSRSQNQIQIVPKPDPSPQNFLIPTVKVIRNNNNNNGPPLIHLTCPQPISGSFSAPPSPSAGSKIIHPGVTGTGTGGATGGTLTSIDTKLRKWLSSTKGRMRHRLIFKHGEVNLTQTNVSKRKRRYLADLFTTLVDIQWRFTLLIFTMSFLLSWLFFAMIWWIIGFLHGDLDPENFEKMFMQPPEFKPCFQNFHGFTSAFLFSIETQHTIGYGSRFTTEECPIAIFTMCMQSIMGVMIQAVMVGIIFAKMSRPKKRTQTLMFTRNAVICQRDGQLCLIFRVGDMRKSHIISTNVRAQLIKKRVTKEGEVLPYYQHELKVGVDSDQIDIFFIWPTMVVHKIDADSPLYGVSAANLIKERFEIVVILEGVAETTGATTQARSSYLPSEILWGHRFEAMVAFKKEMGEYAVDHTLFNSTYEIDTPLCSAKELDEFNRLQDEMKKQGNNKLLSPFRVPAIAQYSHP